VNASLIDVAIVVVGVFIGLSVLASWVQEQIAAVTKLRGKQLYRGIVSLLANSTQLADAVVKHPLINAAVDKDKDQLNPRPSYVEARNFSLSLWQSVHETLGTGAGPAAASATGLPHELLGAIDARISALPDSDLKKTLTALINAAGGEYDKLLAATDAWFDSQMDRVAGWYKRTAQWWLVAIGAVIVIAGGVDTIQIAKQAYASPVITKAFADQMQTVVVNETKPQAGQPTPAPGATMSDEQRRTQAMGVAKAVNDALAKEPTIKVFWSPLSADDAAGWALKVLGLLITIIAVSLGAPFWFDLLKCIINVRMAGEKPDSAPAKKP
jgi:hypothetical protein